ncbi:MAG TPA: lysylphosphatidylglycerol synthase domain-containing protein [Candidatus Sulfotelmatobacter sp.]|nr:lysylphosphatidylglycerol synthase domain-containing protein [Candidatus Sulfotelmatobacter sp.]
MIRTATAVLGLAGLGAAVALIVYQGQRAVLSALAAGGVGLVWASLFHAVPMAINARAWQVLMPGARPPSLAAFAWFVWVREAVNGLLPVARIGGEVVSVRLLVKHGVRPASAVASLVVDMTVSIVSQFVFTVIGLGLLVLVTTDVATVGRIALGLAVTIPIVGALVLVQRAGAFALVARALQRLTGGRFAGLVGGSARIDRAIRLFYRRRNRLLRCSLWQLAGWIAGSGEIWLALYYLGHPVSLLAALLLEALAQAVSSAAFMVPGALGVQEGGFLLFGSLLGLGPEVALALALARRVRDLVVFVPALVTWQLSEGRRLLVR